MDDTTKPTTVGPAVAPTLVENIDAEQEKMAQEKLAHMSNASPGKKYLLLAVFTCAIFMDSASNSMIIPTLTTISDDLDFTQAQTAWIFAAYQITMASFLLISGRIGDIWSPKPVFVVGSALLGLMCLGAGFVKNKIGLLVLRAIAGIGAAFTIPSALALIIRLFPDPAEQSKALGFFGSAAGLGNVSGLLIGAVLAQFASWHWIFFLTAMIAIPIAGIYILFIPPQPKISAKDRPGLDPIGISTLTVAIILFVYALTTGSNGGWKSAGVLAPFVVSIALGAAFFVWETRLDPKDATLPPQLWFYPNFAAIFVVALLPFYWWCALFVELVPFWQDNFHWSSLDTAVRFLPVGIGAFVTAVVVGRLVSTVQPKKIILTSFVALIIATLLLPWADRQDRYWPLVFPAFTIGTCGCEAIYVAANVAIFQTTPPRLAGTVGAAFNSAFLLGAALGEAAMASIQSSVDDKYPGKMNGFAGRSAAFWFTLGLVVVETIVVAVFYRPSRNITAQLGDVEASGPPDATANLPSPEREPEKEDVERSSEEEKQNTEPPELTN